ncbi:MAG: hypothetical protein EU529_10780 [Promethearchaeota archaeon]|nr:MAG: hypothetical protein EU529_10780 [Candidatus Lokiarchaeota archaeon]
MTQPNTLDELKSRCHRLIVQTMINREILSEEKLTEFNVIFYSYLAIAKHMKDQGKEYDLMQFSKDVSNTDYKSLFQENLKKHDKIHINTIKNAYRLINFDNQYSKKAKVYLARYHAYLKSLSQLNSEYSSEWFDESTIKAHCTILVIRDLLVDVVNLKTMDPMAFRKLKQSQWYTYQRNHLFENDKASNDPNRLTLPMNRDHKAHEGNTVLILELLKHRIEGKRSIPDYYKNDPNGWNEFLSRVDYIEKYGAGRFIIKYLTDGRTGRNYFIERFYSKNLKSGKRVIYLTEQQKITLAKELDTEISKVIEEWVDFHPRFIPVFPSYAQYLLPKQQRIYNYLGDNNS